VPASSYAILLTWQNIAQIIDTIEFHYTRSVFNTTGVQLIIKAATADYDNNKDAINFFNGPTVLK
jgi:hypothetical protein